MKQLFTYCIAAILFFPHSIIAQDTLPQTLIASDLHALAYDVKAYSYTSSSSTSQQAASPYHTSLKVDGPIIVAGVGLTYLGTTLIKNKKDLTPAELATKTKDKVNWFDRGNAGYYSEQADKDSYVPFKLSFAWPVVMALLNKNERSKFGQISALYLETMAVTGTLFTMSTGNIYRSRPLVYGTKAPTDVRVDKNNQRSFFAGHTAATAAACFFTAKVFSDFNPDAKGKAIVWAVAAATPAVVGYLRYKAGMHFLSDNLIGYALGAGAGILIPQWHKSRKAQNVSIVPQAGFDYKGIAVTYKF